MRPLRAVVIATAILAAAQLTINLPAGAESKPPSAPLSLTPPSLQPKKPSVKPSIRQSKADRPVRSARRHAASAVVSAAAEPTGAGASDQAAALQGGDSAARIAQLPWWRSDEWVAARNPDKAGANQLMAIAQAWMSPGAASIAAEPSRAGAAKVTEAASADAATTTDDSLAASALADASELNTIDPGAGDPPPQQLWLDGVLPMLAGALAAAVAACLLFGFRRRTIVLAD